MSRKKNNQQKALIRVGKKYEDLNLILFNNDGTISVYTESEGHSPGIINWLVTDTLPASYTCDTSLGFIEHIFTTIGHKDLFFIDIDMDIYTVLKEGGIIWENH